LGLISAVIVDKVDASTTTPLIEEALRLARRLGDDDVLAQVLHSTAFVCYSLGAHDRAIALQREQIELDHRRGNRGRECGGLGNLAAGYLGLGLYKQARGALEQAHAVSEALGARRNQGYDLLNFGELYLATADLRKARQSLEQALTVVLPTQDAKAICGVQDVLGFVLLEMGDASGAARCFKETQEWAANKGLAAFACESAAGFAASAVMLGELDEARKFACEAWDYLQAYGWKGLDTPGRVYRACAETFAALGDEQNGRAAIETAHQELMTVADQISEPVWRQSFLENVPAHRALVEMWERSRR